MRDITSWELIEEITVGWNLGNTFDAPHGETSWNNPETTFTMIHAVAEAGFDSVRLPITWFNRLDDDYVINSEWLDRVEQVAGYVLATGMYCIINTHHEGWIYPVEENEEQIAEKLSAIWLQISERFADYNEKLLFESMNEPRLFGTEYEWNGGTAEARRVVNRLNEVFIDTVRATGGRNALRHLMIPTYAASAESVAVEAVSNAFPHDDDKVIVSIHAYTPTDFALNPQGTGRWLPERQEEEIDWMFGRLKTHFLDKNIPVIMGETGAVNKDNLEARVEWARYYFGKARELGIPAYWWDNGIFTARSETSELFGFLDRHRAEFAFPEILEAIFGG
jgi:endoglucanase